MIGHAHLLYFGKTLIELCLITQKTTQTGWKKESEIFNRRKEKANPKAFAVSLFMTRLNLYLKIDPLFELINEPLRVDSR